jgi:predicted SAM-dependent methyltransferase
MSSFNQKAKALVLNARKVLSRFRRLDREAVAAHYLQGDGLEIGALHNPLIVSGKAHVRYVDRMTVEELRRQYPELSTLPLTKVDIIDDGERLSTVPAESQEFVIANHFLEHCENPIETVGNLLRVLKSGGILYMCIPDKRFTFDKDRPVTPLEHLERDYREGPAWSRRQHFEEWVELMEKVTPAEKARERVEELIAMNYSIHYHVWTQSELLELLLKLRDVYRIGIELELFLKIEGEVLVILRRAL